MQTIAVVDYADASLFRSYSDIDKDASVWSEFLTAVSMIAHGPSVKMQNSGMDITLTAPILVGSRYDRSIFIHLGEDQMQFRLFPYRYENGNYDYRFEVLTSCDEISVLVKLCEDSILEAVRKAKFR